MDAGVEEGDEIGVGYDPMIAKLIAHGPTRDEALARLADALAATEVGGVTTNLPFLRWLVAHPAACRPDDDRLPDRLPATEPPTRMPSGPWDGAWRLNLPAPPPPRRRTSTKRLTRPASAALSRAHHRRRCRAP